LNRLFHFEPPLKKGLKKIGVRSEKYSDSLNPKPLKELKMKKLILTLIALLVMSAVSMAQVGTPGSPVSWYAGAFLSLPTSPEGFTDNWKLGYHGMVGAGFNVAPKIQMIGKIEYHKFGADIDAVAPGSTGVDGGGINTWMFGADAKMNLGAPAVPMKPYILGGLGIASLKFNEYETSDTALATSLNSGSTGETVSKVYFNFGGGVEFGLGPKTSWFLQARYVSVATEGSALTYIPLTVGLKFF
jgi:hypothetical protein